MLGNGKNCLYCDQPVQGRADKKFCDDQCRNNYNNQLKAVKNNVIRNINNALKKNRNILESILQNTDETIKVNREKLLQEGFQFKYHTHQYVNKKGNVYVYCYDFGYLELDRDPDWFLVVRKKTVSK
ncbi:hypothetical protein [Echinicola sp. 20G]|uniref:hypothetical protein n=1 Tax=Echinicola sp. 20G TaxID=2781961 RepID=UPI00190FE281|nr:hypothetical protein [Echinicola sp. 20G]